METKKIGAKQIAVTALLLAICIISQFFKNLSVFITGPIINVCLLLAVLTAGLAAGIILSVITPVTSFFITGSPVMAAVPAIIPFVMCGNIVLVVAFNFLMKKDLTDSAGGLKNFMTYVKAVLCAFLKGAFMGLTISLWLIPTFLPKAVPAESPILSKMGTFQMTFSLFQFLTALIGFVYLFIIWAVLRKTLNREEA